MNVRIGGGQGFYGDGHAPLADLLASDLDVLVYIRAGTKFSLLDLVGVSHVISDELGIPANIFMRRSLDSKMAESISRDVIEVFDV